MNDQTDKYLDFKVAQIRKTLRLPFPFEGIVRDRLVQFMEKLTYKEILGLAKGANHSEAKRSLLRYRYFCRVVSKRMNEGGKLSPISEKEWRAGQETKVFMAKIRAHKKNPTGQAVSPSTSMG